MTALAVLAGYALHLPALVTLRPGLKGMSPLTALGLIAIAVALIGRKSTKKTPIAAAVALLIAVAALLSHAVAGRDAISPAIVQTLFAFPLAAAGRTSIATALGIGLLGTAILLRLRRSGLADLVSACALVIAGTALLGYAYGVSDLYALPMFNTMALHTAALLFLLAGAALLSDTTQGWASIIAANTSGGSATRRQLLVLIVPPVAGWLLLNGTNHDIVGLGASMALLVVVMVVPLALIILRDGRSLDALDRERRAKAELQASAASDLERRLSEQAAALAHESAERAKAEAVLYRAQRIEAVGQLTGGIAHDFNNLLMAIRGNLEMMAQRAPADDAKMQRYLTHATAAADKGAKVTAQLLAFSRSQRLDIRAVELDPVLISAREMIGSALGPQVEVQMDLRSQGVWVSTDPGQLELAILNLAINAREAMPDGGAVRISSFIHPLLDGQKEEDRDEVVIRVTDTGVGMSEEVASRAIEPFFTTKEKSKGTGLGLAQVYGFARQSGGDVAIITALGEGTSVEISLKTTQAPEPVAVGAKAAPHKAANAPDDVRPLLLVIDDDDGVRSVIVEALLSAGFSVEEAGDGPSGLAILERCRPAAAVIDFIMPGMNGAEVARLAQIRQPGLPIVFVSGYSETVALDQIAGAVVLRKPFQMDMLSRTVNSVLH